MELSVLQESFKKGLSIVGHAVAGKSTLPILSNVLLKAEGNRLTLAATNLEIGLTVDIGAGIESSGAITVSARLLSDVVGGLPNDKIALMLDERTQTLNLKCARFEANIKGIDHEEFPIIPTVTGTNLTTTIPPDLLKETINLVAFAAATDDTRPVLSGVFMRLKDSAATFAAADGYRLAVRTIDLAEPVDDLTEVIIPARALIELGRILNDVEELVEIVITPSGGQVMFRAGSIELVSRIIDGKFPDYERIIPAQYDTRTILDTAELAKAVKLASYFAVSSSNIVKLTMVSGSDLASGTLTISANAAEVGSNQGVIDGMVTGEGGILALNVKLLADAINAIKTPQIVLETQTPQSPGVFKPVGADGQIVVCMPMTVR